MKKKIALGGAAFIIMMAAVLGMTGRKDQESIRSNAVVETVYPSVGTIRLYTSLIGTVESGKIAHIYPEISGTVTAVFVKAGDTVEAGQPLCTIDTKQVENARNTMENAAVSDREARATLSRMEPLYQSGFISRQEYDGYLNDTDRAAIAYKQAAEEYERQLSYSSITAPIEGLVEKCDVEELERVTSADQLCVISSIGNKTVLSSVTENVRTHISIMDTVSIKKNGVSYTGVITEMSQMVDETTGLYEIKIQMDDTHHLATGTVVELSLCSNQANQVITVPVDSVYYENSLPYVFTYDQGTVHKIYMETGIYDNERMEVRSGIDSGDEIIITWSPELYEGAPAVRREQEADV